MEMEATQGEEDEVTHLPECSESMIPDFHNERWICICAPLRACEQRVAAMRKDNGELWLDGYGTGFQDGHTFALDAAEAAVAELPLTGGWTTPDGVIEEIDKAKAVAAIRALKEKP